MCAPPFVERSGLRKKWERSPGTRRHRKKKSDLVHGRVPPLSRLVPAVNALEVSLAHGGTGEPVKERKRNHVCESTRDGGTRCASKDDVVVSMEASRAKARCRILGASGAAAVPATFSPSGRPSSSGDRGHHVLGLVDGSVLVVPAVQKLALQKRRPRCGVVSGCPAPLKECG